MIPLFQKEKIVIYFDEAGINLDQHKKRAWCDKGEPFFLTNNSKSINYTVVGAFTRKEVLGYAVIKGSMSHEYFLYFIGEIQHLFYKKTSLKEVVFVLDQAKQHVCNIVKNIFLNKVNCIHSYQRVVLNLILLNQSGPK